MNNEVLATIANKTGIDLRFLTDGNLTRSTVSEPPEATSHGTLGTLGLSLQCCGG